MSELIWEKEYGPFKAFGYVAPEDIEQFLDESLSGKSMIAYAYLFDTTLGNHPRWRCFKSDYGSGKILEVELNRKKLEKARKSKSGDVKEKIIGEIKIRKVA